MNTMQSSTETLITIPYEATDIRAAAKALGARWRPATKQWALPTTEAAATIRGQIEAFEGSASIRVHRMHDESETGLGGGDIIREEGAWLMIVRTEREWCDPDDGDCNSMFDRGFHYYYHCRLATEAEYRELEGQRLAEVQRKEALRAAGQATDTVKAVAFEREMQPPAEGSERLVEMNSIYGFGEWWHIEPEGTADRRIIHTSYRGGDGDGWHDGNYGSQNCTGHAVPWTADLEGILRTAELHWNAN